MDRAEVAGLFPPMTLEDGTWCPREITVHTKVEGAEVSARYSVNHRGEIQLHAVDAGGLDVTRLPLAEMRRDAKGIALSALTLVSESGEMRGGPSASEDTNGRYQVHSQSARKPRRREVPLHEVAAVARSARSAGNFAARAIQDRLGVSKATSHRLLRAAEAAGEDCGG